MKNYSLIAIICLALIVFISYTGRPAPSSSSMPEQKECDCRNLKALQAELHNAIKLQQAFQSKIAELRNEEMSGINTNSALKTFAEREARQGQEPVPGDEGPREDVDYDNNGSTLNDPIHPGSTFNAQQLCEKTCSATEKL